MSFGELQIALLDKMARDFSNFKKTGESRRSSNYLGNRLIILDDDYSASRRYHEEIFSGGKLEENLEKEDLVAVYDNIQETYQDYRCVLLDAMDKFKVTNTPSTSNSTAANPSAALASANNNELRLPALNIPTFSGVYTKWRSYRDVFSSMVHNNHALSEIQKLHHLKSSLQGEAERLVQHLGLESGNYLKAWDLLNSRYDHKRMLVTAQLKMFFGQSTLLKESSNGLKSILDTSQECIHALHNLDLPVQQWDVILIHVMFQKLPNSTQALWEEKLGNTKELPTLKQFIEFLEIRFRTLEAVDQQGTRPNTKPSNTARAFHAKALSNSREPYKCKVCHKGQHSLRVCKRFEALTLTQKMQAVHQAKVCENCLAYSHTLNQCPSQKSCYFCHQRHHTLLHPTQNTQGGSPLNKYTNAHSFQHNSHSHTFQPNTHSNTFQPNTQNFTPNTYKNSASHVQQHNITIQPGQVQVNPEPPAFQPRSTDPSTGETRNVYHGTQCEKSKVLLATAIIKVQSAEGRYIELRALIDPGSEATFISESATQLLNLQKHRTFVEVSGLGKVSSGTSKHFVDIKFASRNSTFKGFTTAFVFKSLTGLLPAQTMTLNEWHHIKGLKLADPSFYISAPIDLLLGSDVYAEIILPEIVRSNEPGMPIAQKTELGWIVLGQVSGESPQRLQSFTQVVDLDAQMRKFWEIEEAPYEVKAAKEDIACDEHFSLNTIRRSDGRYEVALPFKGGRRPELGLSQQGALKRFSHLERRFFRDPNLKTKYSECIEEYLTLNHMEEVDLEHDTPFNSPNHYFLPHHAVLKESSSTTKLRVVFDAGFKTTNGTSLNDHLLVGPKLQQNIVDIILRWRKYRYTFTADIEKMYRQVGVRQTDQYYQTIFWRDTRGHLKAFRLKTVTFGTASAPYLAIRTLNKAALDEATKFPIGARAVQEEMYVDDLISGEDSIEEALLKRDQIRNVLSSAGFNLRKWTSNSSEIILDIPTQDREIDFEVPSGSSEHVTTLGVKWFPANDLFSFQITQPENSIITKRSILSAIAKLFDPLGWISPCVIKAKILMQQLWGRGADWDQSVPEDVRSDWEAFCSDLPTVKEIQIPRWININKTNKSVELHGFSDASIKAYGAAVYIRVLDDQDQIHMHLLISKTKVAPLKTISLPRLELCAAVTLATILQHTAKVYDIPFTKCHAWTDSTITLAWIRAPPSKWTTFVSNRVSEIQRLTNIQMWRHISTHHNPADLASRGILPSALKKQDLWWKGPTLLRNQWSIEVPDQSLEIDTEEERRGIKAHCAITQNVEEVEDLGKIIRKFSKLQRLIRIVAFCHRFGKNCRSPPRSRKQGALTPEEMRLSTTTILKATQKEMFPDEILQFTQNTTPRNLKSLNAFLDGEGILRVGGRLQNAMIKYSQQHPIILKANHHLTELIIRDAHQKTQHGGIQQMAAYIRSTYWIFNLKRSVKKAIHNCVVCFRHKAQTMKQLMGSLPAARVRMARPFSDTGVDYAGPIEMKTWKGRGAKTIKGYFAVFVCLSVKAIHLELVTDMTTQAFLAAFKRFTARRGICSQIFSDCGTNFVGANAELSRMMKDAKHDWTEVADILANHGTKWNFIPPASPHFGGLWEAGVKSVKHHLKRVVGLERLTYEELATLLTQIEACLNSRPLCPLSDNPDDLEFITPAHFLIGEPLAAIPENTQVEGKVNYLDRWKRIQMFANSFWRKWSGEYLARLQQRPKWTKREKTPNVGDLVILKEERFPPTQWALARITEIHPGKDDLVRVVTVKTKNGEMKRPITKLCFLPSNKATEDNTIL